jgi:hypothetical protein
VATSQVIIQTNIILKLDKILNQCLAFHVYQFRFRPQLGDAFNTHWVSLAKLIIFFWQTSNPRSKQNSCFTYNIASMYYFLWYRHKHKYQLKMNGVKLFICSGLSKIIEYLPLSLDNSIMFSTLVCFRVQQKSSWWKRGRVFCMLHSWCSGAGCSTGQVVDMCTVLSLPISESFDTNQNVFRFDNISPSIGLRRISDFKIGIKCLDA